MADTATGPVADQFARLARYRVAAEEGIQVDPDDDLDVGPPAAAAAPGHARPAGAAGAEVAVYLGRPAAASVVAGRVAVGHRRRRRGCPPTGRRRRPHWAVLIGGPVAGLAWTRVLGVFCGLIRPGPGAGLGRHLGHLRQGVGGVGLDRFDAALNPGPVEKPVGEGGQRGHEQRPDLGVVAHPQIPRPVGVGVTAQKPLAVDPGPAGLGVGLGGRADPGALLAQLGVRRLGRPGQQLRPGHQGQPPRPTRSATPDRVDNRPRRASAATSGRVSSRRAVSITSTA